MLMLMVKVAHQRSFIYVRKASVVDNMIAKMEKYTDNLEDIVTERTAQLQDEKRKTEALLYRMLPQ